jgi:hypothetical protein
LSRPLFVEVKVFGNDIVVTHMQEVAAEIQLDTYFSLSTVFLNYHYQMKPSKLVE